MAAEVTVTEAVAVATARLSYEYAREAFLGGQVALALGAQCTVHRPAA